MFRFSIRDVLWLMVAVAMGAAWWADRTKWRDERAVLQRSHDELKTVKQVFDDESWHEFVAALKSYPQDSIQLVRKKGAASIPSGAQPKPNP